MNTRNWLTSLAVAAALVSTVPVSGARAIPFALQPKDHICIIGNTLADRMQYDGWLETMLHAHFPKHDLVIRNLGFTGDEVATRLRGKNFGTPDEWLSATPAPIGGYSDNRMAGTDTKADVVFAFFGYNESYAGQPGLEKFKKDLADWITHTQGQKYNGKSAPRIVLFSPIAHEDLKNPDLPDGKENNARLSIYTRAMAEVAQAHGVRFVDLFAPSAKLYAGAKTPLTINGVHLNANGNRQIAQVIDRDLFGAPPVETEAYLTKLRQAVVDKNQQWFNRYRVTDGFATYGDRAFLTFAKGNPRDVSGANVARLNKADILPTNYDVLEREVSILDVMTANRDRRIWAVARGLDPQGAGLKTDDSDTPPPINAMTNEAGTGPNGAHVFLDGEEAITKMTVGKGLKVELFASEKEFPELANPVQMAFDTRGRLWVAAWKNYPHWEPKTPMDDKLLILEDTNGDGKADKCTVFAGDLNNPTGFEFYNGGVILAQQPNVVFLKDTNGDDKYDVKEILLHGFDSADTHHGINSFTFDPGGALYMQEGIFNRTSVESPWGPALHQADGGVYRFEPRTAKIETYIPFNFPNPHGHVFDSWGRDIVFDATGGQPYYGPSFSTKKYYPAMETKNAPKPGTVRTRPVGGTEILSSRHFPEEMQGNLLVLNNIGFRGILSYKLTEDGAGLKINEVDPLFYSADENFRPVDAEVAPDGSLYIADWHNPLIGHMQHNLRDTSRDHTHGRIYRVTAIGRPLLTPKKIAGEPIEALLDLLKEPEDRVRYRTKIELSGRDTAKVMAALQVWVDHLDPKDPKIEHHLMEALWVHQWHNRVDEALLKRMLRSPEPWARAAATRVLCYWRDRVANPLALLKVQANDEHPAVRLEAVRAASFFQTPEAVDVALTSLNRPQDRFLEYTLDQAMLSLKPFDDATRLLNRSLNATAYQLNRLTNDQLTKIDRKTDDAKYRPVYMALLARKGMAKEFRDEALTALVKMDSTNPTRVLLEALAKVPADDTQTADRLVGLMLAQPVATLRQQRATLLQTIDTATAPPVLRAAYGGLMSADGNPSAAWQAATSHTGHLVPLLRSVPLLPAEDLRIQLFQPVASLAASTTDAGIRAEATGVLAWTRRDVETFRLLAQQVVKRTDAQTQAAAIRGLQLIPESVWPKTEIEPVARAIVTLVQTTPAARRTDAATADALQLGDKLAGALPDAARVAVRRDLRALGVQVVPIETIPEQMRYDVRWFPVEAGKPVQIVLHNADAMPHNVVVGQPKSVLEIGNAALTMALPADPEAKAYVPNSPRVLFSTKLVSEGATERLNFTAPREPGEYVFLCTFPGHFVRMYGVMLVVDNMETWEAHPTVPTDPVTGQPFGSRKN